MLPQPTKVAISSPRKRVALEKLYDATLRQTYAFQKDMWMLCAAHFMQPEWRYCLTTDFKSHFKETRRKLKEFEL